MVGMMPVNIQKTLCNCVGTEDFFIFIFQICDIKNMVEFSQK
jgi:hypothetical protein